MLLYKNKHQLFNGDKSLKKPVNEKKEFLPRYFSMAPFKGF